MVVPHRLAPFRPERMLERGAMTARNGEILHETFAVVPAVVLRREHLRPSQVATRQRLVTQPQARELHDKHPDTAGLRWWSSYEALWANVTLFDRAALMLRRLSVHALTVDDPVVVEAADFFAMRVT